MNDANFKYGNSFLNFSPKIPKSHSFGPKYNPKKGGGQFDHPVFFPKI